MSADGRSDEARRDELMETAESGEGFERLSDLVQGYLDQGVPKDNLLEDLEQIRWLVDETAEERVLDVMDLLAGW